MIDEATTKEALATKPNSQGTPALETIRMQLQGCFSELLDLQYVPRHLGLLDLGGTSMDMLHLQFFIQQTFAIELKFATLYGFSSVDLLSLVIQQSQGSNIEPELFRLRPEASPQAVIAFLDTKGYDFLEYLETSKHMEAGIEVAYLEWKDLDRDQSVSLQMEVFATKYAELLEANYLGQALTLAATCDGAVVAFECLRRLNMRKKLSANIVIIDTRAHCPERMSPEYYVGRIRSFLASSGSARRKKLYKHLRRWWTKLQFTFSGKGRLLLPSRSISWIGGFSLRPQACDLRLIRGIDSHIQLLDDETLGWKTLVEGHFEPHFLPGNHYDLFNVPQVYALSLLLSSISKTVPSASEPAQVR
jgi:surfactin synthase thioesterase subunit